MFIRHFPLMECQRWNNTVLWQCRTQVALKERSEYKKKQDRLRQLYEKARHNSSWKSPDGIASSDGHAKKSMKSLIAKGKRFERESEDFTDIPDREEGIFTKFDEKITMPSSKRVLELSLKELKIGEQRLSENIELVVTGNQHIAIIGNNGIGKSTLLKEIWRQLKDRKDLKGVLTGDGSDELVWGYEYLRNSLKKDNSIASYLDGIGWLKYLPIESLIESTIFSKADIWDLLSDGCVIDGDMPETFRRIEMFKRLPDYHLMRVDRMSMAVGIEARVPFLRRDYVEYMLGLAPDIVICDSDPKHILKDAYRDILPDNLLSTRKIPFLSPVRFWIENIFMEDIIRVFRDKNLIESLGMNSCTVSRIIDNYRGKYEDISNVWGVYVFLKWFEIHNT